MSSVLSYLSRICLLLCLLPGLAGASTDNAVVLIYHHVSTSTPPSTSISPEQFRRHLQHLKDGGFQVRPLTDIINALQSKQRLTDKTVAITFDDGYRNILTNAHPLLQAYDMPYTVFISPGVIGVHRDQLTWEEVKSMHKDGVTFANHSMYHDHLLTRQAQETQAAWLTRTMEDIEQAQVMLEQQLGEVPRFHAYPFGEFNHDLKQRLRDAGYVGFAQHSGAIASHSDFGALPRFAAAGIYANLKTLDVKLRSLAMPVSELAINDPEQPLGAEAPTQIMTVDTKDLSVARVNCFLDGQPMTIEKAAAAIVMPLPGPLSPGRTRINCTVPSNSQPSRYYWYSQPWFVADPSGQWLH
ncbi:polysaccharide deacetylase family protein [Aestuariibacter halophilus]|uniref:Polysaccharide deacetylase family protein n=1 Tax=Fluctibacter halophilus TaxID=226011 RepID=A0ABS8G994_9ALTE|nr:polysaccharide deacetylase family protein [Aestuariibacter halophilus]MCC2617013.1 polysaccharide deacetylase family protein [Aestuariibacter halophilus]